MDRDDVEGAIAAAQYFLELYPYAYQTGDLDEWREMSHPECVFCASVINNVEELHASGSYQSGGEVGWVSVDAFQAATPKAFSVDATATQGPTFEHRAGESAKVSEGGQAKVYIDLTYEESWRIRGVNIEPVP